jgi:ParB family chromosome partitioning protein
MKISISEISIKARVRHEIGDLSSLMKSMQDHGQLNSITITRDNELIAGHRRLLSAQELGWTYIDASIVDRNSEVDKLQLELEENVHRKDFSPEELLNGYRRLEKLLQPSITRRISNFFGNIFSKLLFWKKRKKSIEPEEATIESSNISQAALSQNEQASINKQDVEQYGV